MKLPSFCRNCASMLTRLTMENLDEDMVSMLSKCINCKDDLEIHNNRLHCEGNICTCFNGITQTLINHDDAKAAKTLSNTFNVKYNGIKTRSDTDNEGGEGDEHSPIVTQSVLNPEVIKACFGKVIRHKFMLEEGSTFLNHGSYGAVPKQVYEYKCKLQRRMEWNPEKWFVHDFTTLLQNSINKVSSFLGTQPCDTFLVQNATKGCNTVIKACPLAPGDAILINNLTYPAIANTAKHAATMRGAEVVTLDITFPITSEDDLVGRFEKTLKENSNIKLAVLDHITSSAALLMPVKRLTEVCHRYNVIVLIDGAHTPGQLIASYSNIDADFYTGNFHKWAFTPRGCAVLWQNPNRKHPWFRPLVTSSEHGTTLQDEFGYEGIKDDTAYYSVTEAIDFIDSIGGMEALSVYNSELKREAFTYLSTEWVTKSLDVPESMVSPFMKLLQLPKLRAFSETPEGAERLQKHIIDRHNIDCKISYRDDKLFYRLSVQIYSTIEDFKKLNSVIQELRV